MKSLICKSIAGFLLLLFSTICCNKDETAFLPDQDLSIKSYDATDCKGTAVRSTKTERYILLKYVESNQLKVEYINAEMNCCPGEIKAKAAFQDNILKVTFYEDPPGNCKCICNYDLNCIIDSIQTGKYDIEIYSGSDIPDAKFSFTFSRDLDLRYDITI